MATLYGIGQTAIVTNSASDRLKDFLSKVALHIPSEVISIYAFGKSMSAALPGLEGWWTIVCWALTIWLRWRSTEGSGKEKNVTITAIAFPIWAFALGGTLLGWSPPEPIPGLLILLFSVIAGVLFDNK
jgi:hypothetical protein